ncbi:hypothetical protein [Cellulosimicrobium sp. Marseille-Q8652]
MSAELDPTRPDDRARQRAALVATAHRRGVRATAEYAIGATWVIGAWFWVIALLIGGVILFVMQRAGDVEITAVGGPAESAPYFLLVMGIVMPLAMVALHVAAGGTRRSFFQGLALSGVVVGVTFGAAAALVAWVTWWAAERYGWPTEPEVDRLYTDGSQFGLVLLVQSVFCAVYFLVGVAVALGYYRSGFWRGTGIVLVTLVPLAVAELSLQSGWFGWALARAVGLPVLPVWGAALGGVLAVVLAALLVRAVLRDVAVRPVEFAASVTRG